MSNELKGAPPAQTIPPTPEQSIVSARYTAFAQKQQLTTDIRLAEIRGTQLLSVTRAEDIQAIRDWAKTRAVQAD